MFTLKGIFCFYIILIFKYFDFIILFQTWPISSQKKQTLNTLFKRELKENILTLWKTAFQFYR